jgi:hypothetical protein
MNQSIVGLLNRRRFCVAGTAAFATLVVTPADAEDGSETTNAETEPMQTGNGEWTYRIVPRWGQLPQGIAFGGTHGGIATDKGGRVYVSTQSNMGILVYSPAGVLLKTIAGDFPEIHSLVYAEENGVEYFYATVQHGTPKENWLFVKMGMDGTVVQRIVAPPEAGFKTPNEWRLTAAVPAHDGSIFIANGYGDSRIFKFTRSGQYQASYAGKGSDEGLFNCSHGLAVDMRYDQPLLLVCDRENHRLCHLDFDGKFVRTIAKHLRRPCQVSLYGDYAIVSELEGRVSVLDRDNTPVAFLGDNPRRAQWANYRLKPDEIESRFFSAAHGCHIDHNSNIYISDWNQTGRVTALVRLSS